MGQTNKNDKEQDENKKKATIWKKAKFAGFFRLQLEYDFSWKYNFLEKFSTVIEQNFWKVHCDIWYFDCLQKFAYSFKSNPKYPATWVQFSFLSYFFLEKK